MAKSKHKKTNAKAEIPAKPSETGKAPKKNFSIEGLGKLLLPVFIIYCGLIIWGITNHESWADEAQSWLIARDNSIAGILKLLPSEGHPPLWYLILYPVTHAGLPYVIIKWLAAIVAIAATYIMMFRTNMNIMLKLLLPFSYVFFFEYSLFGRSYCFIIFFLAAIISLYPKRFERPWLFALAVAGLFNTHILIFFFAFGITGLYFIDTIQYKKANRHTWGAFALMALSGLYLVPYLTQDKMTSHFARFITDHSGKIVAAITGGILIEGNQNVALLLFIAAIILLLKRTKPFLLVLFSVAGVLYILGYRYGGTLRHFAVLFVTLFGGYGIADYYNEDKMNVFGNIKQNLITVGVGVMCIIIIAQMRISFRNYNQDMTGLYSDSRNAAEYIENNVDKDAIIVAWEATTTLGTLPYLPHRKLYYAECQRYGTHYIYDSCFRAEIWMNPVDYAVKIAHDNFSDSMEKLVFLFNFPIMPQTEKYLDLLYKTSDPTLRWDESYYIYKFKENVK